MKFVKEKKESKATIITTEKKCNIKPRQQKNNKRKISTKDDMTIQ